MGEQWIELFDKLPAYLGGHLFLSLAALAVSLMISLPLGIAASRRPHLAEWVLGIAGVVQTVPSLALLALMVLVLGGLIGFWPAFLALTLYSILPILANTVVGIRGVDPSLVEAARGLGMSERQMLFKVQLPLAMPVIISGIRTATVLAVGTATLVTPVGGISLGNYIFGGLESMNNSATIFGCVCAAILAILLDQLIRLWEKGAARRDRKRLRLAYAGMALVILAGLYSPVARLAAGGNGWGVVASGPFTEQNILSEVLAGQLGPAGFRPDQRLGMSEGIQIEALRHNQVDCMVNYAGNIWTLVMKRTDFVPREQMLEEIRDFLKSKYGIVSLGSLGFENAYGFAIPRKQADELKVHTIEDLAELVRQRAALGKPLRFGGDNQFWDRPEWREVKRTYGIREADVKTVAMDPSLMYGAVTDGQVDVIAAYTSDGRIRACDLELLEDPRRAFPPYDALLLLSPEAARRPELVRAVEPLVGSIDLELMQEANRRVDVDGKPARVVGRWLAEELRQRAVARGDLSRAPLTEGGQ
jgi:osmoprotectant transport system permease protein